MLYLHLRLFELRIGRQPEGEVFYSQSAVKPLLLIVGAN